MAYCETCPARSHCTQACSDIEDLLRVEGTTKSVSSQNYPANTLEFIAFQSGFISIEDECNPPLLSDREKALLLDLAEVLHSLTPKQREIIDLWSNGFSQAEIASLLGFSRENARKNLRSIQTRLTSLVTR